MEIWRWTKYGVWYDCYILISQTFRATMKNWFLHSDLQVAELIDSYGGRWKEEAVKHILMREIVQQF